MANEGYDKDLDITRLVTDIENELAANALKSQDPVVQRTIKMCVFHIILKAISLSKDPKADKRAILSLYDSAKEIIINSTLDEDETTQNRLQDLVNSMIDGDDISAQLRSYTATSRQWLDSKIMYLEAKLANISSQTNSIHDILKSLDSKSTSGSFKRFPGVVVVLITGFLAMLFTIMTSVVIISFLLTSAINNEGLSMEQQHQLLQHDSK